MGFKLKQAGRSPLELIGLTGMHIGLLFMVYLVLVHLFGLPEMTIYQLRNWDGWWYASVAEKGYVFSASDQSNLAFYPLFPYTWKLLWKIAGFGVEGVCLFNACVFFLGLFLLRSTFRFSALFMLFIAGIPSNMFMLVPYSESLFFLFSSVFITGIKLQDNRLKLAGLFLASLTRPTAYFFFPALLVMEVARSGSFKTGIRRAAILALAPLSALLIVVLVQYWQTGVWFAYFRDGWHRELHLPEFPVTTWDGAQLLWLDGMALFFSLLAFAAIVGYAIIFLKKKQGVTPESPVVFSLVYLVMPAVSAMFMGSYDSGGGTTIASLNRYVMATPFFAVALFHLTHQVEYNVRTCALFLAVALCTYLMLNFQGTGFSRYTDARRALYPWLMMCPVLVCFLAHRKFNEKFLAVGYLVNIFIMVMLLSRFSRSGWVGESVRHVQPVPQLFAGLVPRPAARPVFTVPHVAEGPL